LPLTWSPIFFTNGAATRWKGDWDIILIPKAGEFFPLCEALHWVGKLEIQAWPTQTKCSHERKIHRPYCSTHVISFND
jgi:hypothetical protein